MIHRSGMKKPTMKEDEVSFAEGRQGEGDEQDEVDDSEQEPEERGHVGAPFRVVVVAVPGGSRGG
jgi:hypothetical protein